MLGCHRRHSRCNQAIVPSDTGRPVLQPPAWVASRSDSRVVPVCLLLIAA